MKRYLIITYAFSLLLLSCELKDFLPEEWALDPELYLSESGIVVGSIAEDRTVTVTTNYNEFKAYSSQPWCIPTVDKKQKHIIIHVESNDGADQRTAVVTVEVARGNKSLQKDVTIYQIGGKWDIIEGTDIRMRWAYDVSESQKAIISEQFRQLTYVEGGTALLGAQNEDPSTPNYSLYFTQEENRVHQVTLSDYYIGKYEVTQEQWAAVMATSPSRFEGGNKPVENISWKEAQEYVTKLANLTGLTITLPTSAQWEYAARGGKFSMGYMYSGSNNLDEIAHHIDYFTTENSPSYSTSIVGQKKPNELGLYDMSGNVSELCSDWYGIVSTEQQTDPTGPNIGQYHIERGGDFTSIVDVTGCVFYVSKFILTSTMEENKESFTGVRIVMKK